MKKGRGGLAGIQWLLLGTESPEARRQVLASLLPSADMLGPCRLHRAKYKPGYYPPGSQDRRDAMPDLLNMQAAAYGLR